MTEQRLLVKKEGDFTYPIAFCRDFSALTQEIQNLPNNGKRLCVVTDSNVAPLFLKTVAEALKETGIEIYTYILPAGEQNKTLENVKGIYAFLIQNRFYIKDILAALVGGPVGEMTDLDATTYLL